MQIVIGKYEQNIANVRLKRFKNVVRTILSGAVMAFDTVERQREVRKDNLEVWPV